MRVCTRDPRSTTTTTHDPHTRRRMSGSWVVGRGSWVMGRGSWVVGRGQVVGRGSWVVGRGSWVTRRAVGPRACQDTFLTLRLEPLSADSIGKHTKICTYSTKGGLPRRLRPCRTLSRAAISRPATALGLALGGGLLLHHARSAHQAVRCATGWFLLLSGPTLSRSGLIATGLQVRSKQRAPRVPTAPRAAQGTQVTGPPVPCPKPGSNGFRYRSDPNPCVGLGDAWCDARDD